MKRVLKVLNVFLILLLVVGCTTSQSVTQKLAGEYIDYDDDGDVNKTIILEKAEMIHQEMLHINFMMLMIQYIMEHTKFMKILRL